ncbi:MAG TPA: N-formylglutamate amidohydrolase [Rhodanobacteraceae bacterium]|nr:N-formylglutamate amidohydrolase [Rhodanobacteraceae bacterium]
MNRTDQTLPAKPFRGRLLAEDEPPPFSVEREDGKSAFVLICDHAGRRIPRSLGTLGVAEDELSRHIVWDIGARGVASHVAAHLDAVFIAQTYSRLVIDCNRPIGAPTSITTRSERTEIPGNRDLAPAETLARAEEIFAPYHRRIVGELDRRRAIGRPTLLVSMHSFTPVFNDVPRPWHIGMLYNRDARLAHALLSIIRAEGRWVVGDNEPYSVSDGTDYAVPVHGEQRGLPHVEIEIRQDLITDDKGQSEWAERIAGWLLRAEHSASFD